MKLHHTPLLVLVAIGLAVAGVAYASSGSPMALVKTSTGLRGPKLTGGTWLVTVKASRSGSQETCGVTATTANGGNFVDGFSSGTFTPTGPTNPASAYASASFSGVLDIPVGGKVRTYLGCTGAAPDVARWWAVRLDG